MSKWLMKRIGLVDVRHRYLKVAVANGFFRIKISFELDLLLLLIFCQLSLFHIVANRSILKHIIKCDGASLNNFFGQNKAFLDCGVLQEPMIFVEIVNSLTFFIDVEILVVNNHFFVSFFDFSLRSHRF